MTEPTDRERVLYAFGHLVGSFAHPEDAHAGDSADLADDVLVIELDLTKREVKTLNWVAEYVAENYHFTGAGLELERRIEEGERLSPEPHADPAFYGRHGFCPVDCGECKRLDREEREAGMTQEEIVGKGLSLALAALREEDDD